MEDERWCAVPGAVAVEDTVVERDLERVLVHEHASESGESVELVVGQMPTGRGGVRPDLLGLRRSGDDRRDTRHRREGRYRELQQRVPTLLGEPFERVDATERRIVDRPPSEPGALGRRLPSPVLPG